MHSLIGLIANVNRRTHFNTKICFDIYVSSKNCLYFFARVSPTSQNNSKTENWKTSMDLTKMTKLKTENNNNLFDLSFVELGINDIKRELVSFLLFQSFSLVSISLFSYPFWLCDFTFFQTFCVNIIYSSKWMVLLFTMNWCTVLDSFSTM